MLVSQSIPTVDFFYVCVAHLGDRHFASRVADPPESSAGRLPDKVSATDIDKVKAEWEAKQKEKREKEKQATDEKEKHENQAATTKTSMASSVFSTITSTVSGLAFPGKPANDAAKPSALDITPAAPAVNAYPLHAKYALHREFYAARTREWNNRNFKKRERELNMPPAPRNTLG